MKNVLHDFLDSWLTSLDWRSGVYALVGPNVLRADAVGDRCYSLTGETLRNGRSRFTLTVTDGTFTTAYEVDSYSAAQRWYNRLLRGRYPRPQVQTNSN